MTPLLSEVMRTNRALLAATALFAAGPCVLAAGVPGRGTWETTLHGRDLDGNPATFEAYYDSAKNITWLADANYAQTTQYDTDGYLTWDSAQAWAASLNVNGVVGWRLPFIEDVFNPGCDYTVFNGDCGYNGRTSTSEMAHMYYVTLGNLAPIPLVQGRTPDWGLLNTGPFSNLGPVGYWTGVEDAQNTFFARVMNMEDGYQRILPKTLVQLRAWAVRSGDVPTALVPEPPAFALALAGLAAVLLGVRKRLHH